jgi:hypothetical protein
MYDAGKIIPGVVIFLGLATFPMWLGHGKSAPPPELPINTPAIQQLAEKKCLETTSYMKANHMELLDSWRNGVVREGNRVYVASDGGKYEMSLSHTCLNCHSNKDKFCDRCHNYEGVKPSCWNCHVVPEEKV